MSSEEIELPKGLKFRKQCQECLLKGHLCAILNESLICLQPIFKNGKFSGFNVDPCKFNKEGKIKVVDSA